MLSINGIVELVRQSGEIALDIGHRIEYAHRELKDDGSVVTEADRQVEDFLCENIGQHFPGCNFVTEERSRDFRADAEFTFVIDPIDGTDNFSQGIPLWSISVGILDEDLVPIAGIVFAPRLNLLFTAESDQGVKLNSQQVSHVEQVKELTELSGLVLSSRVHRYLNLRSFPGKTRSFGTAALHLSFPAVFSGVVGAIQDQKAFAWDVAGAHAIAQVAGCDVQYIDGGSVDYNAMKENQWKVENFLLAGKQGAVDLLVECIDQFPAQEQNGSQ